MSIRPTFLHCRNWAAAAAVTVSLLSVADFAAVSAHKTLSCAGIVSNCIRRCEEAVEIVLRWMETNVIILVARRYFVAIGNKETVVSGHEMVVAGVNED